MGVMILCNAALCLRPEPKLMLPSVPANARAGRLPQAEDNGAVDS